MNEYDEKSVTINPNASLWWKFRRRLAFISLFFGFFQTMLFIGVAYHNPEALVALGVVVGWSYSLVIFVIGGYLTNTGIDQYMVRKKDHP